MVEYGLSFKVSEKDPDCKILQCAHLWCMAVSADTPRVATSKKQTRD